MNRSIMALSAVAALVPTLPASAQQARVEQLDEIVVQGEAARRPGSGANGIVANDGFVPRRPGPPPRRRTPVAETPQTINTVTQKQLEERRPQSLTEALGYTPGVRTGGYGFDPRFDSFTIRGVDITYTGVFRDGLRDFNSRAACFAWNPMASNRSRSSKGPAFLALWRQVPRSASSTRSRKRPTETKFGEVEIQGGSSTAGRSISTSAARRTPQGRCCTDHRPNAERQHQPPGRPDDRIFIAPAVTFKPNENTKLTILGEYMDSKTGGSHRL